MEESGESTKSTETASYSFRNGPTPMLKENQRLYGTRNTSETKFYLGYQQLETVLQCGIDHVHVNNYRET